MLRSRVLTDFLMYYDEESYKFESFFLDKQKKTCIAKMNTLSLQSPREIAYEIPEKTRSKHPPKKVFRPKFGMK